MLHVRTPSLFKEAKRSYIQKIYSVYLRWFVWAEIGPVVCRKLHRIQRLCTVDERERSHLALITVRPCFSFVFFPFPFFFFRFLQHWTAASIRASLFPLMLQASSCCLRTGLCHCHYSHSPPQNPGSRTMPRLLWASEAVEGPWSMSGGINVKVGW